MNNFQSCNKINNKITNQLNEVNKLNAKLQLLSSELGVSFSLLTELSSQSGLAAEYTYDGVHLTADGYGNWIEHTKEVLLSKGF